MPSGRNERYENGQGFDPPEFLTQIYTSRVTPYPAKKYNVKRYFEDKFKNIITNVGSFKIKKMESNLLLPYYKIKLEGKTDRTEYSTIVVGDEYEKEEDARENVFHKALTTLYKEFQKDELYTKPTPNHPH